MKLLRRYRCGVCGDLIWPWQHYAFRQGSVERWHTACASEVYQETQRQYSYEDFLARLEDEDGGW